jgi:hypothetical protein
VFVAAVSVPFTANVVVVVSIQNQYLYLSPATQ